MKPSYDMELFLTAVLKGAHTTRRRHINQARLIQVAIQQRWQRDNPWRWQLKHLQWFMREHLAEQAPHSRYYYGIRDYSKLSTTGAIAIVHSTA